MNDAIRPKILICDDKHANLVALRRLLGRVDADLVEARTGNQALAMAVEQDLALALLDVEKPAMDGFEKPIDDKILLSKVSIFLDLHSRKRELEKANLTLHAEVTQRRMAEKALKEKAAELVRTNHELQQFAYIVSHDLRGPLTSINGFAREIRRSVDALKEELGGALPGFDQQKHNIVDEVLDQNIPEALDFITSGINKMEGLIAALLKLSRLGRLKLEYEDVDVNALVARIAESLAFQIDESGLDLAVGALPKVTADRTALDQIFSNLLSNAVKFTSPERPGRIELAGTLENDHAVYTVSDNGRGMTADEIPKAFEIFGRVGEVDQPGEGMGLAYVNTMVRRLGGTIECESARDRGTTFTVRIPIEPPRYTGEDLSLVGEPIAGR